MHKFKGKVEKQLYDSALKGEDTDVELKFGGPTFQVLHAHRAVLVSESNVFKAMLKDCWKRNSKKGNDWKTVLDLPVDDVEVFKTFLLFLYGSEPCPCDSLLVIPTYNLADKYEATRVIKCCEHFFFGYVKGRPCKPLDYDDLDIGVLAKLLVVSKTCHNEDLYPHVFKQVMKNLDRVLVASNEAWLDWEESIMDEILDTDTLVRFKPHFRNDDSKNELFLFERAIQWIEHQSRVKPLSNTEEPSNPKNPRVVDSSLAVRILQKIRFPQMHYYDFHECLERLVGIFTLGQIGQISLQYVNTDAKKIMSVYGNEDCFVMDTRFREMEHDDSSSDNDSDFD